MRILTREELLNPTKLKTERVETPELGEGTGVILTELSAFDRMKLSEKYGDEVKLAGSRALLFLGGLLRMAIVGENGKPICTEEGDIEKLLHHNIGLLKRLGEIAMPLSGIGVTEKDDDDEEQEEPDAVKNSGSEG